MRLVHIYGLSAQFQRWIDRAVKEGEARGEVVVGVSQSLAYSPTGVPLYSAVLSFEQSPRQPEEAPRVVSESGALDR